MLRKLTVMAILFALLISAFPTAGVLAAGPTNKELEKKWDGLLLKYDQQTMNHQKAHKWVEAWLVKDTKATAKEKAEVEKYLFVCNTALDSATVIVNRHAGFDLNGKVINKNLAFKSIRDLSNALNLHAVSVRKIQQQAK